MIGFAFQVSNERLREYQWKMESISFGAALLENESKKRKKVLLLSWHPSVIFADEFAVEFNTFCVPIFSAFTDSGAIQNSTFLKMCLLFFFSYDFF